MVTIGRGHRDKGGAIPIRKIERVSITAQVFGQQVVAILEYEERIADPDGFPGISQHFGWAADNTVSEHAQWLAEAVRLAQASGKTRLVIIFNVDFTSYDPNGDPQAGYAIVRPDGSCPACDALGRG